MSRPHPNTKRFEVEDLRRVPVEVTDEARAFIDASGHQGRLFPQGLSEAFGSGFEDVELVSLSLSLSGGGYTHLDITVSRRGRFDEEFHIAADALSYVPVGKLPAFQAWIAADELVRLYRAREGEGKGD